jgi:RimJ/RimL family protein N-acetyltransferase
MTQDILTHRLVLRPPVPADAGPVQEELAKWDIARMLGRVPHPLVRLSDQDWWAERHPRAFPKEGAWVMLSHRDDPARRAIGNVSLCPHDDIWDLGYWLAEDQWGKGLMSEAVEAVLKFVEDRWTPEKIEAGAFQDNPASARILEKSGFICTGITPHWCEARQADVPHWNFEFTSKRQQ